MAELGADGDRFMLQLYAALAEKEVIAERTRAALTAKKAAGASLRNRKKTSARQVHSSGFV